MTDTQVRKLCEDAGADLAGDYPREVWEEGASEIAKSMRDQGEVPKRYSVDRLADWIYTGCTAAAKENAR